MDEAPNTYANFIADFPYELGWMENPKISLPGKDITDL
jgi:hypothetical protein